MEHAHETTPSFVHIWSKRRLIAAFWIAQAVFVVLFGPLWIMQGESVGGPEHFLGRWRWDRTWNLLTRWDYWGSLALIIGAIMLLQAVLVWPVRRPRVRTQAKLPVWLSLGAASLMGTLVAAGLVLGIGTLAQVNRDLGAGWDSDLTRMLLIAWYVVIGSLIFSFCSRRLRNGEPYERVLSQIAATIFTGTLVEAAAIMPIDILFRKREDCYCGAGTFWAYTLLLGAGLVVAGPAILLPIMLKRRKRWYAGRCGACGYDMSGQIASGREVQRCPECGCGWAGVATIATPPARCERCSYDLGATAGTGGVVRCPECGHDHQVSYARV